MVVNENEWVHTDMYGVDVSNFKPNVLSQVAYWQVGHTWS